MIDHKAVAKDVLTACNKHRLDRAQAIKCLIYTASKLIAQEHQVEDAESAGLLSRAALEYEKTIQKVERVFKNRG